MRSDGMGVPFVIVAFCAHGRGNRGSAVAVEIDSLQRQPHLPSRKNLRLCAVDLPMKMAAREELALGRTFLDAATFG
jgi:hypothetical protein